MSWTMQSSVMNITWSVWFHVILYISTTLYYKHPHDGYDKYVLPYQPALLVRLQLVCQGWVRGRAGWLRGCSAWQRLWSLPGITEGPYFWWHPCRFDSHQYVPLIQWRCVLDWFKRCWVFQEELSDVSAVRSNTITLRTVFITVFLSLNMSGYSQNTCRLISSSPCYVSACVVPMVHRKGKEHNCSISVLLRPACWAWLCPRKLYMICLKAPLGGGVRVIW